MSTRLPLVLGDEGNIEQLQSGDTLGGLGGGNNAIAISYLLYGTNPIGVACSFMSSGQVQRAVATDIVNGRVLGLADSATLSTAPVTVTNKGEFSMTTAQWDAIVTGESGGLTPGALYYLDPSTAGNLTLTPPSTPGKVVTEIGLATSTTQMLVDVKAPILL